MSRSGERIFRFADIEVDPSQGCLTRGGQKQYLRQKTLQVLLYLLEERERLVTKEELIERVWAGTAVTDDALVKCIVDIRKALGDDPHHPRFVKTLPKKGYHFIGAVEECWQKERALGAVAGGPSPVEIKEVTSVKAGEEVTEEEMTKRADSLPAAPAPLVSAPLRSSFSRRRLALILALGGMLMLALVVYLTQSRWAAERSMTEVVLPRVAGKKPTVVMYFENQSHDRELDWLREGLADMLITDLARSNRLNVLSRQQLHLLLERIGHGGEETIRLDEALVIGRRSQAEVVVLGSFAKLGEKVRINVQLYDAWGGQVLASESLVADKADQILSQMDLLSLKLASHLGATPEPETQLGLAEVMTENLEAYRYYSLAVEKALRLDNVEAIALLEKAIALDPQFAMAYARIGYVYAVTWSRAEDGKPYLEKAFHLSHRLTEKDKLHITAWYAIANLDFAAAVKTYREIIARYPLEVEAYYRLGKLLAGEERFDEAISTYKQGLVIDADSPVFYNNLGNIYQMLGRHDEAIALHQRGVQLTPNNPNAYDSLGASYQWAGRYEQAIASYQRALELNPEFEVAIVHLGNAYFQQGRYKAALAQYQRYIQVGPSNIERSRGYSCLAWVSWKKGELDKAEAAVKMQVRLNKKAVDIPFLLALDRGDFQIAEKLEGQLFANWPNSNRGSASPPRFPAYFHGYSALKHGRILEAIEHFKEALRHKPVIWNIDAFEDCLANAYLEVGQLDQAIAEYERILKLNPNYPLAQYHLGQAYERKGELARAHAAYERFLQIWKEADADIPEVVAAKQRLAAF